MKITITIVFYIGSVTALILTRVGTIQKGKIFFKVLSSLLFIALWIVSTVDHVITVFDYGILVTLILYMTGDVLLAVIRSKKGFIAGISAFMTGNTLMIIILVMKTGVSGWDIVVLVLLFLIAAAGIGIKRPDFGGAGYIIAVYIGIMCAMVTKAISLVYYDTGFSIAAILLAVGALLYGI